MTLFSVESILSPLKKVQVLTQRRKAAKMSKKVSDHLENDAIIPSFFYILFDILCVLASWRLSFFSGVNFCPLSIQMHICH
jgi:hypothetical protein